MTKFLQLLASGGATGAIYALVALGFVVIYRTTRIVNFAQGGFVVVGAYLAYQFHSPWGLAFPLAVIAAMMSTAIFAALVEKCATGNAQSRPIYAVVMITIGLLIVIEQFVSVVWGSQQTAFDHPWGNKTRQFGEVRISDVSIWTVILAALAVGAFFILFRKTRVGLAMRAVAIDPEAALAQGIAIARVRAISWAAAGAVGALAGAMLASRANAVDTSLALVAFSALPAVVLGGLDSPLGAVAGGLLIGIAQAMTAGYVVPDGSGFWLGQSPDIVLPYILMVIVLLVRPSGIGGSRVIERV